jgi:hypothetical protein
MSWRIQGLARSPRHQIAPTSDYTWAVLARILAVALDRGWVGQIHASGEGRRPLKTALDAAVKQSGIILPSTDNKPWTADRFCSSWQKACKKADRRDLQRSSRNGTNKARNRGLHRGSNRRHHRSHDARGAVDSRRSLFTSRPSASRRSNQEARSENKLSQTSSQLGLRVLSRNRGKVQCDQLAGGLGFEPRLAESESAVLPLDDPPVFYC